MTASSSRPGFRCFRLPVFMPGKLEIFRKNKSRFRFSAGQSESGKALSCIYLCEIMPASDFACSGFLSVSYAVFLTAGNPTVIFPAVWLCRVLLRQLLSVQVNSRFPRQALLLSWQVQAYCPVYRGWRSQVREAVTGSGIASLAARFPLAGENPVHRRHRAGTSLRGWIENSLWVQRLPRMRYQRFRAAGYQWLHLRLRPER